MENYSLQISSIADKGDKCSFEIFQYVICRFLMLNTKQN